MADLIDILAAQSVKIIGANSTGVETTPVNSSVNGDLNTTNIANTSGVAAAIAVSTTAVEMKVGATTLANRKLLLIQAQAAGYSWGLTSGSQPFDFPNGTILSFAFGPNISVWVKKASGTSNIAVAEFS